MNSIIKADQLDKETRNEAEITIRACLEIPDFITGLTKKKFDERGTLIGIENDTGCIVFEVARHQAACGATYTRGFPLAARKDKTCRYSLNPKTGEISEIGEKVTAVHVDTAAFAEEHMPDCLWLSIEPDPGEAGTYAVADGVGNSSETVRSLEDVVEFAVGIVRDWSASDHEDMFEEAPSEQRMRLAVEYLRECEAIARQMASNAWKWRDE